METGEWETCVIDDRYEINKEYPHQVRRKKDKKVMHESISKVGYVQLSVCGTKTKQRVVAMQWVPGYAYGMQVDHINKDRTDNHVSNLRWVSAKENSRNKTGRGELQYEYIEELEDGAECVKEYGKHVLEDDKWFYLPHRNRFCVKVMDHMYRLLAEHAYESKKDGQNRFVDMVDTDGKQVRLVFKKWRRLVL